MNPEERTEIYFKRSQVYDRQQAKLEAWRGTARNKELIRAFQEHLFASGTQKYRVGKVTATLRLICDLGAKNLDCMEKRDAEALVAQVNRREDWSEHTKSDYRRAVKQFFHWFEDEDPRLTNGTADSREAARRFYKYVKDIRAKPKAVSLDYSGIITEEDAKALITKGCTTPFERAMIAILHETGCRVGELLGLRLRDLERREKHALLRVDGKTGERRIPIIQSLPWLQQWLQDHPFKDNPNALIWISTQHRYKGVPMRYYGVKRLLQRVQARAGINKRACPHWYRHSRATILAPRYSESVLCKLMGWTLGSKQVRTYVHLGARQVENEFMKEHGLITEKSRELTAQFCVCGQTNTPEARYCFKCGNALSVGTMLEDEERKKEAIDDDILWFATKVMTSPEMRRQFEEYKAKRGGAR